MNTQVVSVVATCPLPNSDLLTWLGIDHEAFIAGLQQRISDVTTGACEIVGNSLINIHPVLRLGFRFWWETGQIPEMGSFSGYTADDLATGAKGTIKLEPTGIFLMLNTLMIDPEKAKMQLQQRVHRVILADPSNRVLPPREKASAQSQ